MRINPETLKALHNVDQDLATKVMIAESFRSTAAGTLNDMSSYLKDLSEDFGRADAFSSRAEGAFSNVMGSNGVAALAARYATAQADYRVTVAEIKALFQYKYEDAVWEQLPAEVVELLASLGVVAQ